MPCSALCRPSVDCFHNLSEAGNSFQESHKKGMSEFNSLILLCQKFFAGLFLNASIISLLICVCVCVFRICRFLFSAFRLGPFGTNLYLLI